MQLAGLAPAAVAVSVVPWFGGAGRESGRHPRVGTTAGRWAGSRPRGLDLAPAHSADPPQAFTALRHDAAGWQLWNAAQGWQAVQLRPDSLALPWAVVVHFRLPGERWVRGLCIPRDSLAREVHRRLRVRLKFSRRRWQAPE